MLFDRNLCLFLKCEAFLPRSTNDKSKIIPRVEIVLLHLYNNLRPCKNRLLILLPHLICELAEKSIISFQHEMKNIKLSDTQQLGDAQEIFF